MKQKSVGQHDARRARPAVFLKGMLAGMALVMLVAVPLHISRSNINIYAVKLPSGHTMLFEDPAHPALQSLRRREGIDKIVAPYQDEVRRLDALAEWTSKLFPDTSPFPNYPPWDARVILDRIRAGQTGGFCAQKAIVFGQFCQSLGYAVRYSDLGSPTSKGGHFTCSVYLPSRKKWAMFDADRGFSITDKGAVTLSEWDLHMRLARNSPTSDLKTSPTRGPVDPSYLNLYTFVRIYLRSNFVTVPVFMANTNLGELVFEPYRLMWDDSLSAPGRGRADEQILSDNPADFECPVDMRTREMARCETVDALMTTMARIPAGVTVKISVPIMVLKAVIQQRLIANQHYRPLI